MATHDYNIANQSGAAFRGDLNNALSAIVSNNSSATAPNPTFAFQWWVDTSTSPPTLKQRNSSNSGWTTIGQLDTANLGLLNAATAASTYAPLASPTFTGTPLVPTASVGTNSTVAASTAYVVSRVAQDAPTKTGTGASGTWAISITGNAATATSATSATTAGNVSGTVAIANGGTGQTTATNAINALLPSQTGNSGRYLTTNGSAASWGTINQAANIQTFTSSGTWTKPASGSWYRVEMWGGGGSGCSALYGSGGGGGAFVFFEGPLSDLAATETVTVGAGGSAVLNSSVSNAGGNSSFNGVVAYGGSGGGGANGTTSGGGGGWRGAGTVGGVGLGWSDDTTGGSGSSGGGGGVSLYGGGGGGSAYAALGPGGGSCFGGGGGGGRDGNSTTRVSAGGASTFGGDGGTGGPSPTSGGVRGGGGGGSSASVTSGAGGRGEVRIIVW